MFCIFKVEDIYYIKYHIETDSLKQQYKIKLKNENETITVKTNEIGIFL